MFCRPKCFRFRVSFLYKSSVTYFRKIREKLVHYSCVFGFICIENRIVRFGILELRSRVTQNDVTLLVTNLKCF